MTRKKKSPVCNDQLLVEILDLSMSCLIFKSIVYYFKLHEKRDNIIWALKLSRNKSIQFITVENKFSFLNRRDSCFKNYMYRN